MNNENIGRNFLVTKIVCAECSTPLEMAYKPKGSTATDCSDGITGASKVEMAVYVQPCRKCVDGPARELETLRKILKG